MDRETATASVVAAENTPDTPLEALKAQAVAARSYFVAGRGRHHDFDFCDTTHCQFLREPPSADCSHVHAELQWTYSHARGTGNFASRISLLLGRVQVLPCTSCALVKSHL